MSAEAPNAGSSGLRALSIRLPPKLSLGLEVLARAQHRSLNQAVEWALQFALVNFPAAHAQSRSLWEVIGDAWSAGSGWRKTWVLYHANPAFVSFEEQHACGLVANSAEQAAIDRLIAEHRLVVDLATPRHEYAIVDQWHAIITWAWPALLDDANSLVLRAIQKTKGGSFVLCDALGLTQGDDRDRPIDVKVKECAALIQALQPAQQVSGPR